MLEKVKAMLFGIRSSGDERPNPDPIAGQLVIARQRNERAGENARQALSDLLDRNDRMREGLK